MSKGYRSSAKWNGQTLHECSNCNFNALDEDEIKNHVEKHHTPILEKGERTVANKRVMKDDAEAKTGKGGGN